MGTRFLVALAAAALLLTGGAPARAQRGEWVQPPAQLPHVARDHRTYNLDFLFSALKVAPDDTSAKAIEERIWAIWVVSRSDTTNLLMARVRTAIEQQDTPSGQGPYVAF